MKAKRSRSVLFQPPPVRISIPELAEHILTNCDHDDAANLIVKLEEAAQEWGFTCDLIAHFKALEQIYLNEVVEEGEDNTPITPKLIKFY